MSEEDTFKALCKWTFEDLKAVFVEIRLKHTGSPYYRDYDAWTIEREEAAKKAGWTVREYQIENHRRVKIERGELD